MRFKFLYKMTQTQHLQSVILMIAKDIDSLCKEYNIKYYLLGGSALGAIRHQGFIPWDDDLDIAMLPGDYSCFLEVARKKLDPKKYYIQEGRKDWPEDFSKIKLRGTCIEEFGDFKLENGENGIYVDVFRIDHTARTKLGKISQYFCGKLWISYAMLQKGYKPQGLIKKTIMLAASLLKFSFLEKFIYHQYIKYNNRPTECYSEIFGRARFHNAFTPKALYGTPRLTKFEDTEFPVQEKCEEYLTRIFGDYMRLPPENQRNGLHITYIDFGQY